MYRGYVIMSIDNNENDIINDVTESENKSNFELLQHR